MISVKLIRKSVNNVRAEQSLTFQQEDAQQPLSINVQLLVSAKMELNAGIVITGSKSITSHGKHVIESVKTQIV